MVPMAIKDIFNRRRTRVRDEPGTKEPLYGLNARAADFSANRSEAVCAAAGRMAKTLASAPLHIYKEDQVQPAHELERLLSYSPAPGYNAHTFVRDMEFARCTVGRACAMIGRDSLMQPVELDYIDPVRVTTLRARETGDIWHRVILEDGKNGYIHDSDMLCLSYFSTTGALTPASVLRGSLEYDAQIKEFSLATLNGVHDVILINVPGNISGPRRKDLIADILEGYNASGKSALVLDSGVTATKLQSSPVNAQVLDVEKVTKSRVAGIYGMSPHLLGDGESNRASSEEEMQAFLTLTILPAMVEWEAECNKKLLTWNMVKEGYRIGFDSDALSRANTGTLAEKHFKAVRGGWMRPNEVRKREHLSPDAYGDKLMISRDLLPLEINVEHPELLLGGGRQKTNGEGED